MEASKNNKRIICQATAVLITLHRHLSLSFDNFPLVSTDIKLIEYFVILAVRFNATE